MWEIVQTPEFGFWFSKSKELDESAREDIYAVLRVLKQTGPKLGRPYADSVQGSRHSNLKEPFRVIFVFDKRRRAVLLIGGNKARNKRFYDQMIPLADQIFDDFLECQEEISGEKSY